ncbi:unnamed protein product [Rotaria sordida]|uniref:Uncharacterized protein n=1 Tax=Rotaria sordida TaxID=392033 RepID=A0A819TBX0_9BILA|nr:unnamed protein product [Rotaria sordida]CAF1317930.1 unnamed protein product [Rotaria sordida]CAF1416608.1 unnamed protein product [Rotaria sordida]CAF1480610.1 unnamed protein product [Rotaria sordida]CAF3918339.1 unnamed protein product [Rotaria sordida]
MIVPLLRSEARGWSSSGSSIRYSGGIYGGKIHHSQHSNDPDPKQALQYSYTLQAMPTPTTAPTSASQTIDDKTVDLANNNTE